MRPKPKFRATPPPPFSSHPEAEDGVAIFNRTPRSLLPHNPPDPSRDSPKPIISIDGRDVGKIPGRAA